jgi:hypothetical protein
MFVFLLTCVFLSIRLFSAVIQIGQGIVGIFLDCSDFAFPVRNKMNTHSGQTKVRNECGIFNIISP